MPVEPDQDALLANWLDASPDNWRSLIVERNRMVADLEKRASGQVANVAITLSPCDGLEYFFPKHSKVPQELFDNLLKLGGSVEDEYKWFLLFRFGRRLETTDQFRHLVSLKETDPEKWLMTLTSAAMAVSELNKRKLSKMH